MTAVDNAVAEGGAYEVIRKRLISQGKQLEAETQSLNQNRLTEFGSSDMKLQARVRARTENNCIARDIVQVGDVLLFGYNVFIGLKRETKIADVFELFKLNQNKAEYSLEQAPIEGSFLAEPRFINDFDELYRYYKDTKLIQLSQRNGKLLIAFQIGERMTDIRVFRWSVPVNGGKPEYIDNRGERDIQLPPAYDFEWIETTREDAVHGRHPHINILDHVFVETINGDLTIKIENNTENGQGIYSELVEDKTQSLDDAEIAYAKIADLILLKIKPYREQQSRCFIFNTLTESVLRVDSMGESCMQLPEDHGLIFPSGLYLQTGEYKTFDTGIADLKFKRLIRSPNGEDVLYIFYQEAAGFIALFSYNLISKELQNPLYSHGYAQYDNGTLVVFTAEDEPTRIHPMQIWQTPYFSQEFASKTPVKQSFLGKIGNAELVRGISELYSVHRAIQNKSVSLRLYENLEKSCKKCFDSYYWLNDPETQSLAALLKEIANTAELVIDEFEKVQSIRQQSAKTMASAEADQKTLLQSIQPDHWQTTDEFIEALTQCRQQRGHLLSIQSLRYIDVTRINELSEELQQTETDLSEKTVYFLTSPEALEPYLAKIEETANEIIKAETLTTIQPLIENLVKTASGLDLLSELMATLKIEDANIRIQIIDQISEIYAKLNQTKARAEIKQKELGQSENKAQFSAQFKLFSQSLTNALALSSTPDLCDEQLSRLLVQLEELESQFSDNESFLADILEKREETYESFESHKQQLLDAQQRKAQSISEAAARILNSIEKRALKFTEADPLNTYFASDALVLKINDLVQQLENLKSSVKVDEINARFKSIKEQAIRSLRDKSDLFEADGAVIKLGPRHKFSVNTQALDLTIIPRDGVLQSHLTGTDFFQPLSNPQLQDLGDYWQMNLESETPNLYRGEFLAVLVLETIDLKTLKEALIDDKKFTKLIRDFAAPRYKEGYQKGIHDYDACQILKQLIPALDKADLLKFDPTSRALAQIFWANLENPNKNWIAAAQSAQQMQQHFAKRSALDLLISEIKSHFNNNLAFPASATQIHQAATYLALELGRDQIEFIVSKYAQQLVEELKHQLDEKSWQSYQQALKEMQGSAEKCWALSQAWLEAVIDKAELQHYIPEAIAILNAEQRLKRRYTDIDLELTIAELLGDHRKIEQGQLTFTLDCFMQAYAHHQQQVIPAYRDYLHLRQQAIEDEKSQLRLTEFVARPLSSFVRNQLINNHYLPLIGDNLAKQMGTLGEQKRTDLMGLLIMISPPGYGKTTLMEYVASRLGLIFMKINCPSLGHDITSLDGEQAGNSTAQQELEKINLAFEMGNNVMLYLDDIQHTHPEFLQKFISLCDGTRRVEGVWKGQNKTYDMRGKKFCIIMAGNPYTESGTTFKIPDMLANRADIYNLGDILGDSEDAFKLSYIENALTSNSILAPLALRGMEDVYKLIKMAQGAQIASTDLEHSYSGAELNEILAVFKNMFIIRDVILKVNQNYIYSAAQDDRYRTEPAFKLQGSYRNMNKMTEKISAVINKTELQQLIADHYIGEAQLLTTGAEANLLKLAELRDTLSESEQRRWTEIKTEFQRQQSLGGDDRSGTERIALQLTDLVQGLQQLVALNQAEANDNNQNLMEMKKVSAAIRKLAKVTLEQQQQIEVINQPVPGMDKVLAVLANTMEQSIFPLVRSMEKKLDIDLGTQHRMQKISEQLRQLSGEMDQTLTICKRWPE